MEKNKKDVDKVIDKFMEVLKENFEEKQKEPDPYVVAYYDENEQLMGYHASTACNLTQDKNRAKRYHGDNPYPQLAIIRKNLDYTLRAEDPGEAKGLKRFFKEMAWKTKQAHYIGKTPEQIFIQAEWLDDDAPKQVFRYTAIKPEDLEEPKTKKDDTVVGDTGSNPE